MDLKPEKIMEDTAFGYFGKKPKCLQIINNPKGYLILMCAFSFVQGRNPSK